MPVNFHANSSASAGLSIDWQRSRGRTCTAISLPLLNSGRIVLPKSDRLTNQLVGLERRTSRAGKDSIDHAPNAHDDLANAVAGAADLIAGRGEGTPPYFTTYEGVPIGPSAVRPEGNVVPGTVPCLIDFRALEPQPLPPGFKRIVGPTRFWS